MVELDPNAFLFSGNQVYVAELYERYLDDPHSEQLAPECHDHPSHTPLQRLLQQQYNLTTDY